MNKILIIRKNQLHTRLIHTFNNVFCFVVVLMPGFPLGMEDPVELALAFEF